MNIQHLLKTGIFLLLITCYLKPLFAGEMTKEILVENEQLNLHDAAKFRLEFNNDVIFQSDNQFSNGWTFQIHTAVAENWSNIKGPSHFLTDFAQQIPTLTGDDLNYRMSLSIGQIIQTPENLSDPDLITNDVPYAGALTLKTTWIAFNNIDFRGFEIVVGILGRPSLAEQTQNLVHLMSDSETANGWDNQLKTEPIINLNYMRKNKFYQAGNLAAFSFDASISGEAQLGTMFTTAGFRLETRFGENMPRGFVYRPDPIGRFLTYDATMAPIKSKQASIYGSFTVGTSYYAHNLFLDGNVFSEPVHHVEKENLVSVATLAFHYERFDWAAHVDLNFSSDSIDTQTVNAITDASNNYISMMIEWKI